MAAVAISAFIDNIRVRLESGEWVEARQYQKDAFRKFKQNNENEYEYKNGNIHFLIKHESTAFSPIYLYRLGSIAGSKMPIVDWNNVKVFLSDVIDMDGNNLPAAWHDARPYQTWAYFDFMYSSKQQLLYYSEESELNDDIAHSAKHNHNDLADSDNIIIALKGLEANIVFNMFRNRDGSICYQKNDKNSTQIKICDSDRIAYEDNSNDPLPMYQNDLPPPPYSNNLVLLNSNE
jgi:hypothetical protein